MSPANGDVAPAHPVSEEYDDKCGTCEDPPAPDGAEPRGTVPPEGTGVLEGGKTDVTVVELELDPEAEVAVVPAELDVCCEATSTSTSIFPPTFTSPATRG